MRAVLQRVTHAGVSVDSSVIGEIGNGFLILLGVGKEDLQADIDLLVNKIVHLRVFEDENGKMNKSLLDTDGSCLVVSQFTLFADCRHGRRPSFINAGAPDTANEMYEKFCKDLSEAGIKRVEKGQFGADMKVELLNDGPVTILLDSKEL